MVIEVKKLLLETFPEIFTFKQNGSAGDKGQINGPAFFPPTSILSQVYKVAGLSLKEQHWTRTQTNKKADSTTVFRLRTT